MMIKGLNRYKEKYGVQTKEEINLGLDRVQAFLASIDNPQKDLRAVHIAGTNGKGSTLQLLRYILMEAGYTVGTFTSPYIESVNDQLSTNDGAISVEEFDATLHYLISIIDDKTSISLLTDFELLTVLSIVYFSRINKQDMVIFETGMGGLTDSTNVLTPLLSIITNIGLDHMAYLGDSISEIAFQKAGVIKNKVPCVTGVKNIDALSVVKNYAHKHHSSLYVLNEDFSVRTNGKSFVFQTNQITFDQLEIRMQGPHQKENGALAIMAAEILNKKNNFHIESSHIKKGIKKAFWPGRFEVISETPTIILDGAHNPDAISQLVQTLKDEYQGYKVQFVFGALKDKNTALMIKMVEEIATKITFVDFEFPRAASSSQLEALCIIENKSSSNNLEKCLPLVISSLTKDEILVITGSLYLISEVKEHIYRVLEK
jgi:dihydrofolate synthase / folylpolyglutamate synthase